MLILIDENKKRIKGRLVYEVVCSICGASNYITKYQFDKVLKYKDVCSARCSLITRKETIEFIKSNNFSDIEANNIYEIFRMRYNAINQRCSDENASNYKWYGGKGIKNTYMSLSDFTKKQFIYFFNGYKKYGSKVSPERIDNNLNYSCDNLKWISFDEQHINKSIYNAFKATSPNGEIFYSDNKTDFAKQHNLVRQSIVRCLSGKDKTHYGWSFEKI